MVLSADLDEQDFNLIHSPNDALVYTAGQSLYQEGQAAFGVFTLRSGLVKPRQDMGALMDLTLETVSCEINALMRAGAIEPLDRSGRRHRMADERVLQSVVTG